MGKIRTWSEIEDDAFVSAKEIANHLGCSLPNIYLWAQKGDLPKPLKMGERCLRWKKSDINKTLRAKYA